MSERWAGDTWRCDTPLPRRASRRSGHLSPPMAGVRALLGNLGVRVAVVRIKDNNVRANTSLGRMILYSRVPRRCTPSMYLVDVPRCTSSSSHIVLLLLKTRRQCACTYPRPFLPRAKLGAGAAAAAAAKTDVAAHPAQPRRRQISYECIVQGLIEFSVEGLRFRV